MATSQIVFGNETSTTECSDVHIRMIHLRQANKREVDLLAFRQLQSENLFTDMTLVLKVRPQNEMRFQKQLNYLAFPW